MFIKQFFVDGLGHASYMIGSDLTREAAVVDPRRDVEVYMLEAQQQGLDLRYALKPTITTTSCPAPESSHAGPARYMWPRPSPGCASLTGVWRRGTRSEWAN